MIERKLYRLFFVVVFCIVNPFIGDAFSLSKDIISESDADRKFALEQLSNQNAGVYRPSLEMRENVDFLLMPALVMQKHLQSQFLTPSGKYLSKVDAKDINVDTSGFEFDSIITVNSKIAGTHILVFGHYWVSKDKYKMEFYWTEPSWMATNFYYTPSLVIYSDKMKFTLDHKIWNVRNSYDKPLKKRGLFTHKLNIYPIIDLRYAEEENDFLFELLAIENNQTAKSANKRIHVKRKRKRPVEVRFMGADDELIREMYYDYDNSGVLKKQIIHLHESSVNVESRDKGYKITYANKVYEFNELSVPFMEGGRYVKIDFDDIIIGDRKFNLPGTIKVLNGEDTGDCLREVKIDNIKLLSDENVFNDNALIYPMSDLFLEYKEIVYKLWHAGDKLKKYKLSKEEVLKLKSFKENTEKGFRTAITPQQQLLNSSSLFQVSVMLNQETDANVWLNEYCKLLDKLSLNKVILESGVDVCRSLASWQRKDSIEWFIPLWSKHSRATNSIQDILFFFEHNMLRNYRNLECIFMFQFLEGLDASNNDFVNYKISLMKSYCLLHVIHIMNHPSCSPTWTTQYITDKYGKEIPRIAADSVAKTRKMYKIAYKDDKKIKKLVSFYNSLMKKNKDN